MRVLVTGHCGYIGTVMVPLLMAAGHEVIGLDTDLFTACTFGPAPAPVPSLHRDVRDVEGVDLCGLDAIVHLAGLANDPLGNLNPAVTFEINHLASVRLARMAKSAGIPRFIFSSSCSNYGAAGDRLMNEEAVLQPVTPYAISKVRVEQDVAHLADASFSPTFLRNATAYGVSPRLRFDLVLNNLVAWAYTTGRVYIKSDGTPWRPIVHIEDISRAVLAVLHAPRQLVHNQAFNVGSTAENYRIRDLAEIVKATVPGCRIEYAPDAGPDTRCYRADFDKFARTFPAFRPRWDARRGAQELYEAYRRIGVTLDEFEGPKYKRIDHLNALLTSGRLDENLRWVPKRVAAALGARKAARAAQA
ncbi:MAG TPA: SDR family oxidoreductase [Candidatus Acidoferrum sp.]|nr:SDR family oxidoreductase [Candidatus Acidoferrum sp.]